ncbi:tetratricopeptide repeat protein [Aliiroseovarius sp. YM-037]|uniref:tetratricopeptide repeat protein n=1 Tax=Aliiroseovarius sp. YM-037 TaxID=3341728 RepID=UPI003A8122D4
MPTEKTAAVRVRGEELRFLRKRRFPSAEAFAAACGSVSVPTVYRAERGGPILKSYLSRMAGELDVNVDRLIASDSDVDRISSDLVLTGDWCGLHVATDRYGQPYIITEEAKLVQNGTAVQGVSVFETSEGKMQDAFVDCTFKDNVFCGQTRSEEWPFPLDCAVFVLSGTRNFTWLDGYLSWFDLDTERPEFSKYVLIRRDSPRAEAEIKAARDMLDDEIKLMRTRRLLEAGYSFERSVSLTAAARELDDAPMAGIEAPAETGATPPNDARTVVAISPLTVLDEDPTQTFFADGLIDDIATDLARAPGLDVVPRGSFPADQPVTTEIALARGASHVLSGSMRRAEKRLRLNAQLVETPTGKIVWAERYDHPVDEVFATHDSISSDIVKTLCRQLASDAPTKTDGPDPRAYELFLKGRSLYLRGINTHSLRAAEALLARAVDIDPNFARAYAQMSICKSYLLLSITQASGVEPPQDDLSDCQRALDIDPNAPLAHAALGLAHYATGDYPAAETALRTAIKLDPHLFEAQFFLARGLRLQGDRAGAAECFAKAAQLRPEDFRANGLLAEELQALGRAEEATIQLRATLELVEAELDTHPDNAGALAFGAAVLADLDKHERATIWSEWALAIAPDDCLVQYNIARAQAIRGDQAAALAHLARAFAVPPVVRRRLALWMRFDEDFDALKDDRQFQDLLRAASEY